MVQTLKYAAAVIFLLGLFQGHALGFDHKHTQLTGLLSAHVKGGVVDYKTLRTSRSDLQQYLSALSKVSRAEFKGFSEEQQIAYLVNLYNAATLELILQNYPLKSIKDIGGWFGSPWKQKFISLFGKTEHLDHVEHEILRKDYKEPRIHFALVCAAYSCPPLRSEAFVAERLSEQLDDQGRVFLQDARKNKYDVARGTLQLSKIFSWFKEDFGGSNATVAEFVRPYLAEGVQTQLKKVGSPKVTYLSYDWSLNDK